MPNNYTFGGYGNSPTAGCGALGQPRCGSLENILTPVSLGSVFTFPSPGNTSGGGVVIPQSTATAGGVTINNTVLDKTLNAILSGLALLKGANKIPTTLDVTDGYSSGRNYSAAELEYLRLQGGGGGANTAGRIEAWVKNNTGATVIIALVGAALFLPPLTGSKKR